MIQFRAVLAAVALVSAVPPAHAGLPGEHPALVRADLDGDGTAEVVYGTKAGCVHILKRNGGGYTAVWTSELLRSPVVCVLVDDFDRDYEQEIIAGTADGSIHIIGSESRQLEWDNRMEAFGSLAGMLVGDFDNDGKKELVAYNSQHIYALEEGSFFQEWTSDEGVGGESVRAANVDREPGVELVTNTGYVIDPEFYRIKWEHGDTFGHRIWLEDIDNDGMAELLGEHAGGDLVVYDLDVKSARIR